jgi:multidrug efflux pump subunit AcrB
MMFPKRGIMIAMILPALGFISFPFLKADFFPELDRNMFKVLVGAAAKFKCRKF